MSIWARLRVTTGVTLILWAVSERIFWAVVREEDTLLGIASSLLPYWFATYAMLALIDYFRLRTFPELVLAGAFYGWFIEALVAMTTFGIAGIPLPFSLSWTALSWHMLISVVLVWWLHRRAMGRGFLPALGYSIGLGAFWALWNMTWFLENPPITNDLSLYSINAFAVVLLMILGHWLMGNRMTRFMPTRAEGIGLLAIIVAYFTAVTVTTVSFLALGVPLLAALLYVSVRHLRSREPGSLLAVMTEPVPVVNVLTLLLVGVIAALSYGFLLSQPQFAVPVNIALLFVTTPLGFGYFVWAWWKVYRQQETVLSDIPMPPVPMPVPPKNG